jgi:ribosomal protein S18 acetylase RimI-like enzyme
VPLHGRLSVLRAEPEVRQPERDARQGRSPDASAENGGSIDVRELIEAELALVDARLPLHRLDSAQTYLIAWDGDEPTGHAHISWEGTRLGAPEIQDVFVREELRGRGIGTELSRAAERLAAERGYARISISASVSNVGALRLYRRLGYRDAGLGPQRVAGTIEIRGKPVDIDDTLLYLVKDVAVDFEEPRSSYGGQRGKEKR